MFVQNDNIKSYLGMKGYGTAVLASMGIALWVINTNISYQAIGMSCCGMAGAIILISLYRFWKLKKIASLQKSENLEILEILRNGNMALFNIVRDRLSHYSIRQNNVLNQATLEELNQYLDATLRGVKKAIVQLEENLPSSLHAKRYYQNFNIVNLIKLKGAKSEKIKTIERLQIIFSCYKVYIDTIEKIKPDLSQNKIDSTLARFGSAGGFYEISLALSHYSSMQKNALGLLPLESVLFGIYCIEFDEGSEIYAGFHPEFRVDGEVSKEFDHFFEDRVALAKMLLEKMLKENNIAEGDPLFTKDLQDSEFITGLREVVSGEKSKEEILLNTKNYYLKCLLPALAQITRRDNLINWVDYVEKMIPRLTPLYEVCASRQKEIQTLVQLQNCFGTEELNRNISKLIINYI